MTSATRYCASIRVGLSPEGLGGRTIQVNFESPRAIVQALKNYYGPRDIVLKLYEKGGQ
jgi:hypothetical protein